MSLKPYKLKISLGFLKKAVFPNFNFSVIAGRMFATARPKEDPTFVELSEHPGKASRAHLTARCPHSLSCVTRQEERPLPQHEPDPIALMAPLRTPKPNWQYQLQLLNGWRQPLDLAKDRELEDSDGAPDQESLTQRLENLLNSQNKVEPRDAFENCVDRSGISRINLRLEEERQESENLGPPETLKPYIQDESPSHPYSTDSATFLATSQLLTKSPSYPKLQEAPRSVTTRNMSMPVYASFTSLSSMNTKEQSIKSTVRPAYHKEHPHPHPINIVRPDIPPLSTTFPLSEKVLRLQKARDSQVELSEKRHKSRAAKCTAWIKRKIFY